MKRQLRRPIAVRNLISEISYDRSFKCYRVDVLQAERGRQLDVLQATLGQNVKFVIPGNADLVTVLGLDAQASPLMVPMRKAQNVTTMPHHGGPAATS